MSVVGPRPPLPREVAQYDEWAMQRLAVKPGLTGPWQVGGRSDVDFDDMVRLDLQQDDLDARTLSYGRRVLWLLARCNGSCKELFRGKRCGGPLAG